MSSNHSIKSSLLQAFSWIWCNIHSLYVWMIGRLMDSKKIEPKNEECQKTHVQSEGSSRREMESEDTVDFPGNDSNNDSIPVNVLQALEGVSGAIYKVCFSKWHCPPEEMKEQPLFKEINAGIRGIYYNIRATARPLEEYEILIAIVNALITHLKNFRKKRITYRNKTPQEEADFIRKQTNRLLLYWLPDSLRKSSHILVFLNEILSINVLTPSINNLADSTFINETILKTLASEEVPERDGFETHNALNEPCAISQNDSDKPVYSTDSLSHRKGAKRLLKKIKGLGGRSKCKKPEEYSAFRLLSSIEEDTMDCTDGCTNTVLFESFEDDLVSSVIDNVLRKWLQEKWTAKICESPTQDRNTYKISVSKEGSSNANLWITERSVKDFRQIYNIVMEYQDLEIFATLEEAEIEDNQFFQAIGIKPDTFIDELLKLIKHHQKAEPIFFFTPINYEEEKCELSSRAFSDHDLAPEDNVAVEAEIEDKVDESTADPDGWYKSDGPNRFQCKKKNKKSKHVSGSELEDTSAHNMSAILYSSEDHAPATLEKEDTAHHSIERKKPGFKEAQNDTAKSSTDPLSIPADEPSVNYLKDYTSNSVPYLKQEEEHNKQKKKLEDTFLDALYCLADELFSGGKFFVRFSQKMGFLDEKSKEILAAIPKLYTEDNIVWYLNQTSELLLADVCPLPVPPHKLPSMAQEILIRKVKSLPINTVIKLLFGREISKNIKASHQAFQNSKANKETLFRIIEDLTRIITNGSQESTEY